MLAQLVPILRVLDDLGRTSAQIVRNEVVYALAKFPPILGRQPASANLDLFGPISATLGPLLAKFDQTLAGMANFTSGHLQPEFGQIQPRLAQERPDMARIQTHLTRSRLNEGHPARRNDDDPVTCIGQPRVTIGRGGHKAGRKRLASLFSCPS